MICARSCFPSARIAAVLRRAGAPATPQEIGLARRVLSPQAVRNARFLRDRYTFLDLADDAGRLTPAALG